MYNLTLHHDLSYVQIDTFERCPRKWGWEWLEGLIAPKNKFSAFGIYGHGVVAGWLKNREFNWSPPVSLEHQQLGIEPKKIADVAAAIVKELPPPQDVNPDDVEIQQGMVIGGVSFVGAIDLWHRPTRTIYDHKFVTSFRYCLTPEAMADDVQATLYAAWVMISVPEAPSVRVQWTYGKREGKPESHVVRAELTGRDIQGRVSRTVETGRIILQVLKARMRALDLPINPSECEAFGGCPYKGNCNLTPKQVMEAIMSQSVARDNLMEKLKARKNGEAIQQPIVPDPPAPVPVIAAQVVAPTVTAPATGLAARIAAKRAEQAAPVPVAEPAAVSATAVEAPAEPAAEETHRGPGRPPKTKADSKQVIWNGYAAEAMSALIPPTLGVAEPAEVAELAAQYADAMQVQFAARFGG